MLPQAFLFDLREREGMPKRQVPTPNRGRVPRRKAPARRANQAKTLPQQAGLTELEWAAVGHYFTSEVNFSRVEACRRAGYAHAHSQAFTVFSRPAVVAEVELRRAKIADDLKVGPNEILQELKKIAFFNPADYGIPGKNGMWYIDLSLIDREQMAAIGEITNDTLTIPDEDGKDTTVLLTKIKPLDKLGALDRLARHLSLFTDNLNLSVNKDLATLIDDAKKRIQDGSK